MTDAHAVAHRADPAGPPRSLYVTALTHRGIARPANEDCIAAASFVRSGSMSAAVRIATTLRDPIVCLVADGMGGHSSGEVASAHVATRLSEVAPFLDGDDGVQEALEALNDELYDRMEQDPSLRGMGSTVAGVIVSPGSVCHFNVGDSRLYRIDTEYLVQLSVDDNPGASRIDAYGQPVEVTTSVVTQALGGSAERMQIAPHVSSAPMDGEEAWLLCSDGLSGCVPIDEMEAALTHPDAVAVNKLFALAMSAGGPDNISIVIVRVAPDPRVGPGLSRG